jgi:hypothetical protein
MLFNRKMCAVLLASAVASFAAIATSASATVTIADTYYGGLNTYNGADVIGESVFDTNAVTFSRINGGNTLHVVIDTNYAGASGIDGTGYGAFFVTPGANAWQPSGSAADHYATDIYKPGEWAYAFALPQYTSDLSGTAYLYAVGAPKVVTYAPTVTFDGVDYTTVAGVTTENGSIVMSNVGADPITYPYAGNPGWFFRQGQAVQFTPNDTAQGLAGSWSVTPGSRIVLDINDGGKLGNAFAFSWAMTCGNDVIQGQVGGVPEPATWAMLFGGFFGLGAVLRRRRRQGLAAA